jgi:hypothetical protein
VVEAPVAAQRQPVDLAAAGGHLDGGGAVAGGEAVPGGEPGHEDGIADDGGGDDRPGAEDLGEAGAGCSGRGGQLRAGVAPPGIEVADAGQQLSGELTPRLGNRLRWADLVQEPGGLACGVSSGTPPGISSHNSACSRQTAWLRARDRSRCRLAHTFSTRAWPSAVTSCTAGDRSAATATGRASLGSFLPVLPVCSSRTRAASCWAWAGQARTPNVPSASSAPPTATAVCEPLCGSIPIITAISMLHFHAIGPGQTDHSHLDVGPAMGCVGLHEVGQRLPAGAAASIFTHTTPSAW